MPKQSDRRPPARKGRSQGVWWAVGTAVAVVAGMIGLQIWLQGPSVGPAKIKSDAERGAERSVWGSKDARVELVEFGDFL